jgi:2,3-bisphosphoglycerate-independent phosphoglycerate mutase
MSLTFVFLDGLGLAAGGPENPLTDAPMPAVRALLQGPLTTESVTSRADLLLRGIDAGFGIEGLPQSGTNHIALLAGVAAPLLHGRHQPYFPPVGLQPLLREQSIFRRLRRHGRRAVFANVFPPGYYRALRQRKLRRAASVLAAEAAGLALRTLDQLRAGAALSWDITAEGLAGKAEAADITAITAAEAGQRLAAIGQANDFVFFESYLPDLAGHGRLGPQGSSETLARIDGLISGWLAARRSGDSLLICSDHGNIESTVDRLHSAAAVPLLVIGPHADAFRSIERIDGLAATIVECLS